ncbi:MAG: tetratricopeptide repeat protein [Deltaproteobacteria bacterium]|nr:tetratricopeptide repeat protein [Deltaproteobacteria bacterium]MBN2674025.1 tetratricopeptide repeat protein [Deltaproteobacteria bacterium]
MISTSLKRIDTRAPILKWLFPGLVAAAVYANTLGMDFVWDDFYLILEDHTVKSLHYLDVIFTSDFFGHQEWDLRYGYYRPLVSLTYLWDYAIWQRNPFGYHLTNVLLHVAATSLVAMVLLALRVPQKATWWAALLFAVHPMHTENVAWISGRTDVLAFVLSLLAMWAHLRSLKTNRPLSLRLLATLTFFLSLLAKEPAVVVIAWIGIAALCVEKQRWRQVALSLIPYIAAIGFYLVLRFVIADVPGPNQRSDVSLLTKLSTAPFTLVRYIAWLLLPIKQSAYIRNPFVTGNFDIRLYVGVLGLWGIGFAAYRLKRRFPSVGPFIWMTLVAMLPIAGVLSASGPSDMGAVMAERFLYFPSFPFIATVSVALVGLTETMSASAKIRHILPAFALTAAFALGAKTVDRNLVWKNNELFYKETLSSVPSALIYGNLATHYIHTRQWDKAEKMLSEVKQFNPDDYHLLASRALLHVAKQEFDTAIYYQKKVAAMARRGRGIAYNNLAFLYRMTGDLKKSQALLEEILYNKAGYADVYFNLAEVYRETGKYDEAAKAYKEALKRRPDSLQTAAAFAGMLLKHGDLSAAVSVLETQLEMYPNDPGLLNNLGLVYKQMHQPNRARRLFERAVHINPSYARARLNLAAVLLDSGKKAEADIHLRYIIENIPGSKEAVTAEGLLGDSY